MENFGCGLKVPSRVVQKFHAVGITFDSYRHQHENFPGLGLVSMTFWFWCESYYYAGHSSDEFGLQQ